MSIQLWDDDSAEGSLWSRSFDFDGDGDADCFSTKKTVSLLVEEVRLFFSIGFRSRLAASFFFFFFFSSNLLLFFQQQ